MSRPHFQARTFGRYILLDCIGSGGMAEIHRAVSGGSEGFRKIIAVKRMLPHMAKDLGFRTMLINEAKLAALIEHPNVVQIHDLGEVDDQLYIAMEYVSGVDLNVLCSDVSATGARLPLDAVFYIVTELLRGLDYAHALSNTSGEPLQLIHRDISPSNVLVSFAGAVKLADFGIAKARHLGANTATGTIKGKIPYMAPEIVAGEAIDKRVDLWAVGVIFWEMLAGERLFLAANDFELIKKIATPNITPIQSRRPELSNACAQVIQTALKARPAERFESAGAMADALAVAAQEAQVILSPTSLRSLLSALYADKARREQSLLNDIDLVLSSVAKSAPIDNINDVHSALVQRLDGQQQIAPEAPSQQRHSTLVQGTPTQKPTEPQTPTAATKVDSQRANRLDKSVASVDKIQSGPQTLILALQARRKHRQSPWLLPILFLVALVMSALWISLWTGLLQADNGTAVLEVSSVPSGAQLAVDGHDLAQVTPAKITALTEGTHHLRVAHPGYTIHEQDVILQAGQSEHMNLILKKTHLDAGLTSDANNVSAHPPSANNTSSASDTRSHDAAEQQTGWLSITASPWGTVSIDGKNLNATTPITKYRLSIGTHHILVDNPYAHKRAQQDVVIRHKRHTQIRLKLE